MSSAVLFQANGLGFSFQALIQSRMSISGWHAGVGAAAQLRGHALAPG